MLLLVLFTVVSRAFATSIVGQGSSFAAPAYDVYAQEYSTSGCDASYTASSSGTAQTAFLQPNFPTDDFYGSDPPLTTAQYDQASANTYQGCALGVPIQYLGVLGGISIVVNLPGIPTATLKLDASTLAKIYTGVITNWDDPQIAALNTGLTLPNQTIVPVARADSSGTTFLFTTYLSRAAPADFSITPSQTVTFPATNVVTATGSGALASTVKSTPYSIGYVQGSYVVSNGLTEALVENAGGQFFAPVADPSSVEVAADYVITSGVFSGFAPGDNLAGKDIIDTPQGYPISSFSFIDLYSNLSCFYASDPARASDLLSFLSFINTATPPSGYAPLPQLALIYNQLALANLTANAPPGVTTNGCTVITPPKPKGHNKKKGKKGNKKGKGKGKGKGKKGKKERKKKPAQ